MKNNRAKKILSFVLAASMVFAAMAPTMAYAEEEVVEPTVTETEVPTDEAKKEVTTVVTKEANYETIKLTINGRVIPKLKANLEIKQKENGEAGYTFEGIIFDRKGEAQIDLNKMLDEEGMEEAIKDGQKFTVTLTDIEEVEFSEEEGTTASDQFASIEKDAIFHIKDGKVSIELLNNDRNIFDTFRYINEVTFEALQNGLKEDFTIKGNVKVVDKDGKVVAHKTLDDIEVKKADKNKFTLKLNEFKDKDEKDIDLEDVKVIYTMFDENEKEIVTTLEFNEDGKLVKVNNEAPVLEDNGLLKKIKVNFTNTVAETTRFEIKNYDYKKGYPITNISVKPLIRKDNKSAYKRDKDGNYEYDKDVDLVTLFDAEMNEESDNGIGLNKDYFYAAEQEDLDALEDKKENTAINQNTKDEQNIVAIEFTEAVRGTGEGIAEDPEGEEPPVGDEGTSDVEPSEDESALAAKGLGNPQTEKQKSRTKVIYMNVKDLVDNDIVTLLNPLATTDLDVIVKGGNPSKAIEGAKVEILPSELDTLGVAQYGKAIATGTTKANGKVKFDSIEFETVIKHAMLRREYVNQDVERETILPFMVKVTADGFNVRETELTQEAIVNEEITIDLNKGQEAKELRIAGKDRYETALKVALENFEDGATNVVIASGRNYADALVGARYADYQNAPLLLTDNELSKDVIDFLKLKTKKVTVLGGDASVAPAIQEQLAKDYEVNRLSGPNRYDTAINVAKAMKGVENVFIASGENYADALVASAAANRYGKGVVLLTEKADLTPAVRDYLLENHDNFKEAFVFGGEGSVSGVTMSRINEIITAERVKGSDRDETAVAVANKFFAEDAKAVVASGANYADALVAGTMNQPILLVTGGVNDAVKNFVKENIMNVKVVGGAGSVSDAIVDEVVENLK